MKARSNCNNIMPYIQADAAFCMLNVNGNLKNQTKDNYTTIAITKTMEKTDMISKVKNTDDHCLPPIADCWILVQVIL